MKGMMIKDFNLLKGQKQFFLVISVVAAIFLLTNENGFFVVSYMVVMFSMFSLSTISYDEYENGSAFLFTLPISRKEYVKEKYLFCLVLSAAAWMVFTLLVGFVFTVIRKNTGDLPEMFVSTLASLGAGLLMQAVTIPLQFKFGAEKRQIVMIACLGGTFIIIFGGVQLLKYIGINPDFMPLLAKLTPFNMGIGIVGIVGILFFVSYMVSVRIMEKKEL